MSIEVRSVAAGKRCADRVFSRHVGSRLLVMVADGAGNSAAGETAAAALAASVEGAQWPDVVSADFCVDLLANWDAEIAAAGHGGESTCVVLIADSGRIVGASVGDSEAWFDDGVRSICLTESQRRKPLLGSGESVPVGFAQAISTGTLLVASDGLFKYVSAQDIQRLIRQESLVHAADGLVASPRLASGSWPDDLGLVLSRFA